MNEIDFHIEWEDPQDARGEELRATWARFALYVNQEDITRVNRASSQTVTEYIYIFHFIRLQNGSF